MSVARARGGGGGGGAVSFKKYSKGVKRDGSPCLYTQSQDNINKVAKRVVFTKCGLILF